MERIGLGKRIRRPVLPHTYRFRAARPIASLLRLPCAARTRTRRRLATAFSETADATPYEALILASIVERKPGTDERPLIAGVFTNRCAGMRLKTDPSVIYGLGENFDGNLRRRDLLADTPYNSYMRTGLPPTPIALPGRAALEAAVRPAKTDAIYFVATGRGDGRHFFAETLIAHNANVSRHLSNLRGGSGVQVR